MGRVCNSSCPYYGVDENYNGYCKKDHNSYRDRGSACNMESTSTASSASSSVSRNPRTCTSSCPYYGVDADYNGYCKKDHNSYRERFATCNMGETTASSSSSSSSAGGCGCGIAVIAVIAAILIIGSLVFKFNPFSDLFQGGKKEPETVTLSSEDQVIAYTTASSLNLRKGPSTSDSVVTSMPKNSKVIVEKVEGSWAYVSYENVKGWCSTKYLDIQD